jgi:4-amino-4-deoxy-L-arabinose transferase-like glycosyltransferase
MSAYLVIALRNLTVVPQVYEDEPWQASTGWKLATEGVFGSDLFAGFYGMERHYYGYMPVHPLLLAVVLRTTGLGLFQDRLEPAIMGLLVLVLTYWLGRRLFEDPWIGQLAVLFLIAVPLTGLTRIQLTGILLIDMSRIARYDMVVPVFGLAALHAYISARKGGRNGWFFLAGLLASLSSLAHVYGLFWLPILIVLALWDRRPFVNIVAIISGFIVPLVPYAAYVLGNLYDWRGQTRLYGNRFQLLNPTWYVRNLIEERHRYGAGLGSVRSGAMRIGFWSALVGLPWSVFALARRALRSDDAAARVVMVPLIIFPILFAFLITLKLVNYTVVFMPMAAIAGGWGGVRVWSWARNAHRFRWALPVLVLLLAAIVVEGATRIAALEAAAKTTTPYYSYISRVREYLPGGARVLASHNYWFGLEDFNYRSFIVPLGWTDLRNEPRPLAFEEGLEQIAPDVVLIDRGTREYFAGAGSDHLEGFHRWLGRHQGQLVGQVDDQTYGLMEIYQVKY